MIDTTMNRLLGAVFAPFAPRPSFLPPHIEAKITEHLRNNPLGAGATVPTGERRIDADALKHVAMESRRNRERLMAWSRLVKGAGMPEEDVPHKNLNRFVYKHEGDVNALGKEVLIEGDHDNAEKWQSAGDSARDAYLTGGLFFHFLKDVLKRSSIDGKGLPIKQVVEFNSNGQAVPNAHWDSKKLVMFFGLGDGKIFGNFLQRDVLAHEFAHGITQFVSALLYLYQPGALNESFSDVMAISFCHYLDKTPATAEPRLWPIGEGVLLGNNPDGSKLALRNLLTGRGFWDHPVLGTDPSVTHMRDFDILWPTEDTGGVHIYSGIPNKAFALTAIRMAELSGKSVHSFEQPLAVWWRAMHRVPSWAGFGTFANATLKSAEDLYGKNSVEYRAVKEAWGEVGVNPSPILGRVVKRTRDEIAKRLPWPF